MLTEEQHSQPAALLHAVLMLSLQINIVSLQQQQHRHNVERRTKSADGELCITNVVSTCTLSTGLLPPSPYKHRLLAQKASL